MQQSSRKQARGASTAPVARAAFLLFAALLAVTRADASLPKTAAVADLSRPALQLPAVASSEPSPFGFAEDLALLAPESTPGRFRLFGLETRRFERTYARNNPLRYIDPNGQDGVEAAKWVRAQAQAVADWGGTHDGAHYSSYANVANTMSTVADWLESGSSTGDAIGSGADFHDLGMAFATDLGRVSSFMFSAATAVEGVLGDMGAKRSPTIQENKAKGDAFRDSVAADLRAQKREVATEQAKSTPFGTRVIDVEVRQNGKPLGGIETKTGASPYTPAQRAKDEYLRRVGYPVTVVRDN